MSEIRLQYSGFVVFLSRVVSIFTGFAFQLILIRSVSTIEYGIWGNMKDLALYFTLVASIFPFWTTRFVARKHANSARTGLATNLMASTISATIYLISVSFITSSLNIDESYRILYMIVSIQIIELYVLAAFQAIVTATKPHLVGFGLLIYEPARLILAVFFVMVLNRGIVGVLTALLTAQFIQIIFLLISSKDLLRGKVEWKYLKEWLKASTISLYNAIGTQIAGFGLIMLFAYGTEVARAYYGASFTIANVINYSTFLAFALYPKLLVEVKAEDITTTMKTVLMFIVPMVLGAIILADSYLTILSAEYVEATLVLQLLALDLACFSLKQIFRNVVLGVETLDENARIPFRQLLKSRIFQIFSLPYLRSIIALPAIFYLIGVTAGNPLDAAVHVAGAYLAADVVLLLVAYTIMRRAVAFGFPWKNLAKYLGAGAVMGSLLAFGPHPTRITPTFLMTALSGGLYVLVLFVIDSETRRSILLTLRKMGTLLHVSENS